MGSPAFGSYGCRLVPVVSWPLGIFRYVELLLRVGMVELPSQLCRPERLG